MREVALAVVLRAGRVLLARRPEGIHQGGCWEFPGGGIRPGESPAAAALRELVEETGLVGSAAHPLLVHEHAYAPQVLRLHVFQVMVAGGEPRPLAAEAVAWRRPAAIDPACMPAANGPILDAVRRLAAGKPAAASES